MVRLDVESAIEDRESIRVFKADQVAHVGRR